MDDVLRIRYEGRRCAKCHSTVHAGEWCTIRRQGFATFVICGNCIPIAEAAHAS